MAAIINTNIASLNAQRNLTTSQAGLNTALQRLSTGLRINSAKDDAAGLAISERMTSQIRGLNQAARNANDGISLSQTAEGALTEIGNNLQRIRELAVQSANGSNSASDRKALDDEAQLLIAEIDRVAKETAFNGQTLLDGSFTSKAFQVGADANQTISVSVSSARTATLGAYATATSGAGSANRALTALTGGAQTAGSTFTADEFKINGTSVGGPSSDGVSSNLQNQSAIAVANAINSSISGVTAKAEANVVNLGAVTAGSLAATGLSINGVDIGTVTVAGGDSDSALRNAINAVSNQTGVRATLNDSNQMILTAEDGRNIRLQQSTVGVSAQNIFADATDATNVAIAASDTVSKVFHATDATASDVTIRAQVKITSGNAITIADSAGTAADVGLSAGTSNVSSATSVSGVKLTTFENATSALKSLDQALASINSQRASLGAIQNRMTSTIASLQTTSENLSASRSRIADADFASETAALTRGQIMQQAGTAMLAQANSLPNGVLALLRG